jgi:hypothetical protein
VKIRLSSALPLGPLRLYDEPGFIDEPIEVTRSLVKTLLRCTSTGSKNK